MRMRSPAFGCEASVTFLLEVHAPPPPRDCTTDGAVAAVVDSVPIGLLLSPPDAGAFSCGGREACDPEPPLHAVTTETAVPAKIRDRARAKMEFLVSNSFSVGRCIGHALTPGHPVKEDPIAVERPCGRVQIPESAEACSISVLASALLLLAKASSSQLPCCLRCGEKVRAGSTYSVFDKESVKGRRSAVPRVLMQFRP
jgi:hypothetical protein